MLPPWTLQMFTAVLLLFFFFFFWKNSLLPTAFTLSVCIYLTLIFLYTIWTVKEIEETTYCTPYFTSQGNSSWFQHAVAMVIHTLPWTFPCFPGDVAFTSSHMILLYCKVSADAHVTIIRYIKCIRPSLFGMMCVIIFSCMLTLAGIIYAHEYLVASLVKTWDFG